MWAKCCCQQEPDGTQVAFRPVDEQSAYGHPQGIGDIVHKSFGAHPDEDKDKAGKDGTAPEAVQPAEVAEPTPATAEPQPDVAKISDTAASPAGRDDPRSEANIAAGVEREKGRLHELVKVFLKRAVNGIECEIVDPAAGTKRAAAYYVDRRLRELTVKATDKAAEAPAFDQTFQMGNVTVLQNQAAARALDPAAQAALGALDAAPRLLAVVCDDQKLFLQEATGEDADNFAICMRVLRVYCRQLSQTA